MNHPKFCNIFLVGPSQKKPFLTLGKWKMVFLFNKKNFLCQHCPWFQDACLCGIWIHSNKLCHVFGHNTRHFDRNPRMLGGDSSFLWTSFQQNCRIPSSNLSRFQLNRQKLMIFKRGGWKSFLRFFYYYWCI